MSDQRHLADARRKNIRWRILKVCDSSRGVALSEDIMLQVLTDAQLDPSPAELRKECAFLENKGLITISTEKRVEHYLITAAGTEFVEYDAPDIRSIGRPPAYF